VGGHRDPLLDRTRLLELTPDAGLDLPGAHAVHFSNPEAVVEAIDPLLKKLKIEN